jgi:hypothetical protein
MKKPTTKRTPAKTDESKEKVIKELVSHQLKTAIGGMVSTHCRWGGG